MPIAAKEVKNIRPDHIGRNPENPRLIFRQDEMDALANSMQQVGILVPLTVYEKPARNRYALIDGERRWRCAKKLNLGEVPVIIEPKPNRLENILRMFNIHNVRVQWDLMAIALKLQEIEELLSKAGRASSPREIATVTGLSLATVRRAFDLLTLPRRYRRLLLRELEKPKSEQQLSEDLFIEMMKAIRVTENYLPEVTQKFPRDRIMNAFFEKYRKKVITSVVAFRKVSRIARAERVGVTRKRAISVLNRLVGDPTFTIENAYAESVMWAYEERELLSVIDGLTAKLGEIANLDFVVHELKAPLERLKAVLERILSRAS